MAKENKLLFSITEKDFIFQAKRGSGKGGQKKNKTSSAIQCFHVSSGAMGESEEHREQSRNKQMAFKKCVETTKFKVWLKMKTDAALGKIEIEEISESGNISRRLVNQEEIK